MNRFIAAIVFVGAVCHAQEFEVASLARTMPASMRDMGDSSDTVIALEPTILRMRAITLAEAIKWAYNLKSYELVDQAGRQWRESEGMPNLYYIEGHFEPAASRNDVKAMLQNLLKERMGFESHVEAREIAVSRITKGRRGLSKIVTPAPEAAPEKTERAPLELSSGGDPNRLRIDVHNKTFGQIASDLSRMMRSPLVDATGLGEARYDVKGWYIDLNDVKSLTAMQDSMLGSLSQLGLAVSTGKALVQMRVVDHVNDEPAK